MWTITSLDLPSNPGVTGYMSDGLPVAGMPRGGPGVSVRLMVTGVGMLDITDLGTSQATKLDVGGAIYSSNVDPAFSITVEANGECTINGDGQTFSVNAIQFPVIAPADISLLFEMVELGVMPYPDVPPGGRPYSILLPQAQTYFPWSDNAGMLGLTIYDWTTADFFRMDVFNYFRYSALPGEPLDGPNIVNAIFTTDWSPYMASNPTFMGSMLMTAASTESEVAQQYAQVSGDLVTMLDCLKRVTIAALQAMPRTGVAEVPILYSGQVDVSNLGTEAFVTYFLEYPGNAGPVSSPMGEALATALDGFLSQGNIVTLKSFMSTTNSQADAAHYSTGILLQISPNPAFPTWTRCTYITPLSDEATKTEYLFSPGARFLMGPASPAVVAGKSVMLIQMTALD